MVGATMRIITKVAASMEETAVGPKSTWSTVTFAFAGNKIRLSHWRRAIVWKMQVEYLTLYLKSLAVMDHGCVAFQLVSHAENWRQNSWRDRLPLLGFSSRHLSKFFGIFITLKGICLFFLLRTCCPLVFTSFCNQHITEELGKNVSGGDLPPRKMSLWAAMTDLNWNRNSKVDCRVVKYTF